MGHYEMTPGAILDSANNWLAAQTITVAGLPLTLQNTTDAVANEVLRLIGGNRGTPADGDEVYITFYMDDSTGTSVEYGRIICEALDVTSNTQDAKFLFQVIQNDTLTTIFEMASTASTVVSATMTGDMFVANGYGLVVGYTAQETISTGDGATDLVPEVQVWGTTMTDATLLIGLASTTNALGPTLAFAKQGAAAIGTDTAVEDNEYLGRIIAFGADGTDIESPAAEIRFVVDDTPATGQMGGSIELYTTADAGETLTKAFTINVSQQLLAANAAGPALINEAATSTNPTLIPNQAEVDTGIGWTSTDNLSFILGSASIVQLSTTQLTLATDVDISVVGGKIVFSGTMASEAGAHILIGTGIGTETGQAFTDNTFPVTFNVCSTTNAASNKTLSTLFCKAEAITASHSYWSMRAATFACDWSQNMRMVYTIAAHMTRSGNMDSTNGAVCILGELNLGSSTTQITGSVMGAYIYILPDQQTTNPSASYSTGATIASYAKSNSALHVLSQASGGQSEGTLHVENSAGTTAAGILIENAGTMTYCIDMNGTSPATAAIRLSDASVLGVGVITMAVATTISTGAGDLTLSPTGSLVLNDGLNFIGDTANTFMTTGLTITQGAVDDEAFTLKNADVDQSYLTRTEADTFAYMKKRNANGGGLEMSCFMDAEGSQPAAILIAHTEIAGNTTKTTAGRGVYEIISHLISGDATADMTADGNIFALRTQISSSELTRFMVDEDGDIFCVTAVDVTGAGNAVAATAFDDYDDAALLDVYDNVRTPAVAIRHDWAKWAEYNEQSLIDAGILGGPISEGGLTNVTQLQRAEVGAIRQLTEDVMCLAGLVPLETRQCLTQRMQQRLHALGGA